LAVLKQKVLHGATTSGIWTRNANLELVSDVMEKHRLVVESLASSWKKITTRRREGVGVVVEKTKKVDELSTKIRVIYLQQ